MRLACLLFLTVLCSFDLSAQKYDHVWILGSSSQNVIINDQTWGQSVLDFNYDPVRIYYDTTATMDTGGTNATICDRDGNLRLYTNGMQMTNGYQELIPGAEVISYSDYYQRFVIDDYLPDGSDWVTGFRAEQSISCRHSGPDDRYIDCYYDIAYNGMGFGGTTAIRPEIGMTRVDYLEDDRGLAVFVDSVVVEGDFGITGMGLVAHANGRDYWMTHFTPNDDTLLLYLITEQAVVKQSHTVLHQSCSAGINLISVSPSGEHALISKESQCGSPSSWTFHRSYELLSFDRCSGIFESVFVDTMQQIRSGNGGVFSPDGTILYVNNQDTLVQYDLLADDVKASKTIAALRDTDFDPALRMGYMLNAPDGRIYCIPQANSRVLHTIEYPDRWGPESQWVQESTPIPTNNFTSAPNMPHYRMGPMDGSLCDTLGIDNVPLARLQADRNPDDSLQVTFVDISWYYPEVWEWDMGDGTTYDLQHPYEHTYTAPGYYDVCLTVRNANGVDQTCKTLAIGVPELTSTEEVPSMRVQVYPNPADDYLFVALDDAPSDPVKLQIVDMMGSITTLGSIRYSNAAAYDVGHLSSGVYALLLWQQGRLVATEKVMIR